MENFDISTFSTKFCANRKPTVYFCSPPTICISQSQAQLLKYKRVFARIRIYEYFANAQAGVEQQRDSSTDMVFVGMGQKHSLDFADARPIKITPDMSAFARVEDDSAAFIMENSGVTVSDIKND